MDTSFLLLDMAEMDGHIHGVSICRRALKISNLLFADDSLLFNQANQHDVEEVTKILRVHDAASGQSINLEKSSIFFSGNTSTKHKSWIKDKLGVKEVDRFETYLGMSTVIGKAKYHSFSYLKEWIWKKFQGWKGMMLFRAGKEVLIKVVAQSLLTYTMGVFQLPMKLCDELDALCARFWWG